MKAARLGRIPAHDKGMPHAIQFPRAIRNTIECTLREHSIVMNRIFDAFRCFAAPFAHKKARVNCRIQKEPLHFAMALCYVLD